MALLAIRRVVKSAIFGRSTAITSFSSLSSLEVNAAPEVGACMLFNDNFTSEEKKAEFIQHMRLIHNFISADEEKTLLDEIEPLMRGRRYEGNHWDDAITHYREIERLEWSEQCTEILNRVKALAFQSGTEPMKYVHILDLRHDGVIKPHVDSVKFCGTTIAGISLLSDSVMRLRRENDRLVFVDVLLQQRSLYIMTGSARYDYTHEILSGKQSVFGDTPITKTRRISVICRNEP